MLLRKLSLFIEASVIWLFSGDKWRRTKVSLVLHGITGRGIGTENCGEDNVFPPDGLWFGSDTYTAQFYIIYI